MQNQVELEGLDISDLLGDTGNDQTPNDDQTVEVTPPADIVDDPNDVVDPNEPDDPADDNNDDVYDDADYMETFLKSFGIEDGKTLKFENEDGTTEDVDFNSLSNKEKLEILKDLTTPQLLDHEIETINYLRRNNATLQDVVEYYQKKAIHEYQEQNGAPEKYYSVDDYNDDEMYLADAKAKYPDMSDDELLSDLETAKENEALFTKKVEAIRKQYKAIEDNEKAAAEQAERDRVEAFQNSIQSTLDNFNEISLDYTNAKADSMTIEASEKNKIFEYITKQDSNGMTKLVKDLNDVNKIVSIAWWLNYGQESISNITKYFQKQLAEARKEKKEAQKPTTTRVPKTDKKTVDPIKFQNYNSVELHGLDHLL